MQTIIMYVAAPETLGIVRDSANAKGVAAPTLMRGCAVTLKIRLFSELDSDSPYPMSEFANVVTWQFAMDSDFAESTAYKLEADNEDITVATVTEGSGNDAVSFTEFTIPISQMNTQELVNWLGNSESKSGLNAELVGFDAHAGQIYVLQIKNFTVRGRITSQGHPTPVDPDYLTEAQVNALVDGRIPSLEADPGTRLTTTPNGAVWVYGEDNEAVSGMNIYPEMIDGKLYTLTLTGGATTIIDFMIGASSSLCDLNFKLRVEQPATAGALILMANSDDAMWPSNASPPQYADTNHPPSIATPSTVYVFHLHWDATAFRMLARIEYTEAVAS